MIRHALQELRAVVSTISLPVVLLFLVSSAFNFVAFGHRDLGHTAGSSYAYLFGHWTDFYTYNQPFFERNDYFPTVYLIFAAWMAPVKMLVSPGVQNGLDISSWELLWARFGLWIVFALTVHLMILVARELFPDRERTRNLVVAAYLISPFAAFLVGIFGRYDVLGIFFTLLGLLYYLRGKRWRFALCFAIAASFMYFALLAFAPLLVLVYKRLRDLVALSVVALSVLALETVVYLGNPPFHATVGHLAAIYIQGDGTRGGLQSVIAILLVVALFLLWRLPTTRETLGQPAVYAVALAYGLLLVAVKWNLAWFSILTPFFALTLGYLRRPGRFILWESVCFVAYIWYAVNRWSRHIDVSLVERGALRSLFEPPHLYLGDIYPRAAFPVLAVVLIAYFISPMVFRLLERAEATWAATTAPLEEEPAPIARWMWTMRAGTPVVAWTLPVLTALWIPTPVATAITPDAAAYAMESRQMCGAFNRLPYGQLQDGHDAEQSFAAAADGLGAVSVLIGTWGHRMTGSLTIDVRTSEGTLVGSKEVALGKAVDNGPVYVVLEAPLEDSADRQYLATFRTDGVPPSASFSLWGSAVDCEPEATLTLDGAVQAGDLDLTTYYRR